jgi:purine-binding chemotaxis protein CheW
MATEQLDAVAEATDLSEDSVGGTTTETRQFVIFLVGEEAFAVDLAPVQEIIRLPEVVRVPLAPPALNGLANLRGRILPIVSLRRMFGFAEQETDDSTRAVVIDVGQPLGFVVDRVASVASVEADRIETTESISSAVDSDLLSGLIRDLGGYPMVMVIDFAKLIGREFAQLAKVVRKAEATGIDDASEQKSTDEDGQVGDERQLVSFEVADQEYAIAIEEVQEIVQVPEAIIHVPHSRSHVLGLMTLRSRILPLVNLRRVFSLPERPVDEKSRIVVLTLGSASVGVVVDGVREVLRVSAAGIDAMPPLLAREGDAAEITGICRLEDGKRMVSIVAASNLFDHSSVKEALNKVKKHEQEGVDLESDRVDGIDDVEQTVVFRLDKEEFGVPIASIQEIVRVPDEMTRVPDTPAWVEGVINLRGTVLPVVDLRTRMGLSKAEKSDRQRIMVFLLGGTRTGFVVDQVAEVLRIPKNVIEPAPRLSGDQGLLLSRMANLEKTKRMIQLLDPTHLVEGRKLDELSSVA